MEVKIREELPFGEHLEQSATEMCHDTIQKVICHIPNALSCTNEATVLALLTANSCVAIAKLSATLEVSTASQQRDSSSDLFQMPSKISGRTHFSGLWVTLMK